MNKYKTCIQVELGKEKFFFYGADVSSPSLVKITEQIVRNPRFASVVKAMEDKMDKGISDIRREGGDSTEIGDFAVGNANAMNLATLSRINAPGSYQALKHMARLTSFSDNAFLFSGDAGVKGSKAYIGKRRDFVVLNPPVSGYGRTLSQAMAFKVASRQAGDKNSPVFRTLKKHLDRIETEGHRFKEELQGMTETTAAKKLLLLAQEAQDDALCKAMLEELGSDIKKQAEDVKINVSRAMLVNDKIRTLVDYGNTRTVINGNDYTNAFVIGFIGKLQGYRSKTDVTGSALGDGVPTAVKQLYEDDATYRGLIDDLIDGGKAIDGGLMDANLPAMTEKVLDFLYKDDTEPAPDEDYEPRIGGYEVADDYEVDEKDVYFNEENASLNAKKKDRGAYVNVVLDTSGASFATVEKDGRALTLKINPGKDITDDDVKAVMSQLTYQKGKKQGNMRDDAPTSWLFMQETAETGHGAAVKLADFIRMLNTDRKNKKAVSAVYSTVSNDFCMDAVKAANRQGLTVQIYPYYYANGMDKGAYRSYLENELNLSFSKSKLQLDLAPEEDAKLAKGDYHVIADMDNKAGDVVTVENTRTRKRVKKRVAEACDFKLHLSRNENEELWDNLTAQYKPGAVFSMTLEEDGKAVIRDAVLMGAKGGKYSFLVTGEGGQWELGLDGSELAGDPSKYRPMYMGEARFIDGAVYVRTKTGVAYPAANGNRHSTRSVEAMRTFYDKELREIHKAKFPDVSYGKFLDDMYPSVSSFGTNRFFRLADYEPPAEAGMPPVMANYSDANMLEVVTNAMRRSGVPVVMMKGAEIKERFGEGLAGNKAFITQGRVVLNRDRCTEDSPVHELMHLLLAQYKATRKEEYAAMLDDIRRNDRLPQREELKERYKELSPNDYLEEVLVHVVTDYFMGRVMDYGVKGLQGLDLQGLARKIFKTNGTMAVREDKAFLDRLLREVLLDGDSDLLGQLQIGVDLDRAVTENRISNVKSRLIKDGSLTYKCE